MKKRIRKTILNVLLTATFVAVGGATVSSVFKQDEVDSAYAIENVEQLSQTIAEDYSSTYAVGETVYISNYEVAVGGEKKKTSAVLQKDYAVCLAVQAGADGEAYKFTEAGTYALIYTYTDEQGRQTALKNVALTVRADAPYLDVGFEKEYLRNTEIPVEAKCYLQAQSAVAQVRVISPLGEEVSTKTGSFIAEINGVYTLSYTATVGGQAFEKTYKVRVTSEAETYKDYILPVSGVTATKDNVSAPEWAKTGTGVEVSMSNFGAFRFNNVIDLNALTKEDELIKMLPLGDGQYNAIKSFKIKLIDAYDETNIIEYQFIPRHYSHTWDSGWTYCNVSYKSTTYSLNDNGTVNLNSYYGMITSPVCNPALLESAIAGGVYYGYAPWVRCQVDYADKEFYVYGGRFQHSKQKLVVDLDEPQHVGYGNEWAGFTTGEVYLQVEITSTGASSGCLVQEIAGQKLYGETQDTTAPYFGFEIETNGELPTGVTGKYYPFPAVDYSVDVIEGKNYAPAYTVTKIEREIARDYLYEEVKLTSQKGFIPEKEGIYRITYEVPDKSGNVGVREMTARVKDTLGEKGVSYALPKTLYVGQTVEIPTLTPTGMSTLVKREESVTYNGVDYAARAGETLFLDAAGTFVIKCSYTDHLGQTYETEKTYSVAVSSEAVTQLQGVVPKYVLKGREVVLPNYSAIDYSKEEGAAGYNVSWTLTVDGKEVNTQTRAVAVEKNHGESVEVVYSVNGVAQERYEMTVIEGKYLSDRFYATSGTVEKSDQANYVELTTNADATVEYVFPFVVDKNSSTFPFVFNMEASSIAFDSVDVYFEDNKNAEESVFIRIRKDSSAGYSAQINGEGATFALTQSKEVDGYQLEYNRTLRAFQFEQRVTVKETSAGAPFNGFTSGQVNVRFAFNGVTQTTKIKIYKMSTISFLSSYEDGKLMEYVDVMFPIMIWSNGSYLSNDFTYGKEITLPGIEIKTPLSGGCKGELTVLSPSGKKVIDKANAYDAHTLTLDEYGTYKMTYTVPYRHTTRKYNYSFRVTKEETAEIALAGEWQTTRKIGETFALPNVTVTGAAEGYTVECYLVTPDGATKAITEALTLEQYGTYYFRVMVTDKHNVVTKSWKFTVEG